jgi:hypothetical protein
MVFIIIGLVVGTVLAIAARLFEYALSAEYADEVKAAQS